MRLIAWNVGHRTRAKALPTSVVRALLGQVPDVVVLTEYVAGPQHEALIEEFAAAGLGFAAVSERVRGQNQVVVASKQPLRPGPIEAPAVTPATGPNLLHVLMPAAGCQIVGCRVPMFRSGRDRERYWDWLEAVLKPLSDQPLILVGDLNIDPERRRACGGRHLAVLAESGWSIASPAVGASFFSHRGTTSRLDHALLGRFVRLERAAYVTEIGSLTLAGPGPEAYSDHAILRLDVSLRGN